MASRRSIRTGRTCQRLGHILVARRRWARSRSTGKPIRFNQFECTRCGCDWQTLHRRFVSSTRDDLDILQAAGIEVQGEKPMPEATQQLLRVAYCMEGGSLLGHGRVVHMEAPDRG